jgi:hypothetical protein
MNVIFPPQKIKPEVRSMIHRDLCDPHKTKYYSTLRIKFHFLLSRYVCWDGLIPLTYHEIAEKLSCNIQSIHKFVKKGSREGILSVRGERLYLIKRVKNYKQGYVKHYPFLESAQFTALNVHTQRFILYVLWYGVHMGRPLKRRLSALYHSTPELCGVLNLYSKAPLNVILEQAKTFLKLETFTDKGKEFVRVTGLREEYANQEALQNEGEMKLLENILEENDCDEFISTSAREGILKLKSYYAHSLHSLGMELFSHALKKLLSLHKLHELNAEGQISAYLKSILVDLEKKILPTLQKRISNVKQALVQTQEFVIEGASKWVRYFETKVKELRHAVQVLTKPKTDPLTIPDGVEFPFYNWLETP